MKTPTTPQLLADNLWLLAYPLKMLGTDLRRNVTVIRLRSGKLVIHSTAPFTPEDVVAIHALGEPGWLVDGTLRHDTFSKEGREAFMGIPYLAPQGFSEIVGYATTPIVPAPLEWEGELLAMEIQGASEPLDTALLHIPSHTLILTVLVYNFGGDETIWTKFLLRVAVDGEHPPEKPRPVKDGVTDEAAFQSSLATLLGWDFDRVIVGHGDVIDFDGKAKLRTALAAAGFSLV